VKPDEGKGSKNDDFDNSGDTFVVNLFKECNDNKEGTHESKVEAFDSEDENSIIENMAKKYGDNIFDNSDEEAIPCRFCYEDGPIYRPY